jgi:aminoglycoside 6'-N-acetyltransferase I
MTDVRAAQPPDIDAWIRMRAELWPDDLEEHRSAANRFFAGHRHEPAEVFLAFDDAGRAIGFAELSIRNIVDSCSSERVAYLEGWYVDPPARRHGVGAALIANAERWALAQGCTEFGSDSLIDNPVSQLAHRALGFAETGRVVNYRKDLVTRR